MFRSRKDIWLILSSLEQVSLSLQVRLGLAKLKYQHDQLHGLSSALQDAKQSTSDSEKPFESSSDFSRGRCETPFTSPRMQAATHTKELPRSTWNKHAVTLDSNVIQPMLTASRKHVRSDSGSKRPAKASRKSSHQLPESSLGLSRQFQGPYGEENDPCLSLNYFWVVGSTAGSSSPRTPPQKHARLPPSTSLNQNAATATLRTPGRQFSFADFVNVTPSPTQPASGS